MFRLPGNEFGDFLQMASMPPCLDLYVTLAAAARALKVPPCQLEAWNMVVVVMRDGQKMVPTWNLDPRVVRAIPVLSDVFVGDALELCLVSMRPYGDSRSGVDALVAGDLMIVLPMLRDFRRRFDQFMRADRVAGWLSAVGDRLDEPVPLLI